MPKTKQTARYDPPPAKPSRNVKRWTREEIKFLHRHYPTKGLTWVARELGRTVPSVSNMAIKIGLDLRRLQRWTAEETEYLLRNYPHMTIKMIAHELGRSVNSIEGKVGKLIRTTERDPTSVRQRRPRTTAVRWTEKELRFLLRHFPTKGPSWVAQKLGRTMPSVSHKAIGMGLVFDKFRRWTIEEIKYLIENYPRMSFQAIAESLGRSVGSVGGKIEVLRRQAHGDPSFPYKLPPAKPAAQLWTDEDIRFLRENYGTIPTREIAEHVGRSAKAVARKARELGMHLRIREAQTVEEILSKQQKQFILKNMNRLRIVEIARRLDVSYGRVYSFACKNGYVAQPQWSGDEIAFLQKHFGTTSIHDIAARLGRPSHTISMKARNLGLRVTSGAGSPRR